MKTPTSFYSGVSSRCIRIVLSFVFTLWLAHSVFCQTHESLASSDGFPLPIEVLGLEGSTVSVTFQLSQTEVDQAERLWIQVNSLDYQDKGAIEINDGGYYLLNHSSVEMQYQEEARGGMAHGGFNTIRLSIPVTGLVAGENIITFKYNKENGLSSGYRVIRLNFLDSGGGLILPDSYFTEDDPSTWVGPYTDQTSINEGRDLWYNADLWNNSLPSSETGFWYESVIDASVPIRAKCADCHTQDGRDLEIFSYSNKSIVERAKFHQLSEEEGKKIASYIRSLSSTANKVSRVGRPWNPPFQPGPELDGKPWEEWVAGAGIDAVLDEDADMLTHMFPSGVSATTVAEFFDSDKMSDWTEMPLAIQFPDWKRWLPLVHPKDAFEESWYDNTYNNYTYNPERGYEEYREYLEGKAGGAGTRLNIAGSNPTQMMDRHNEYWKNHRFYGAQYNNGSAIDTDKHWRSTLGEAKDNLSGSTGYEMASTSIARLMAVKNFEFNHEFELMDQAPNYLNAADQPSERQWFHHPDSKHVFEVPAHITGCVIGDCQEFLGQGKPTGQYESTNWYQLQMVISGGNGNQSHNSPVDYNYHPEFILRASWSSKIYEPLRYYFSLNHMYQTKTWTGDVNPNDGNGFRIRVMGPWYFLGKEADAGKSQLHNWDPVEFPALLDDVTSGLTNLILEAQIQQFLTEVTKDQNNLSDWTRYDDNDGGNGSQNLDSESKSSITNVVLPFSSDDPIYADHMWWSMDEFRKLGINQGLIDELKAWCEEAWPNIDWDAEPDCYGIDLPTAELTLSHETTAGLDDGQITFTFEDDAASGGTRSNLELSIDDGDSYVNIPDNSGSYTFNDLAPGKYKVWIRWGDDTCENKLGEPTINEGTSELIAEFSADQTTINEGESVSFTDESVNSPSSWSWTFNGGTPSTSTEQNPTVSYDAEGTYDVTLTVTSDDGSDTMTKTGFITVNTSQTTEHTNLIIIYADDLGWGSLGINGGDTPTPNIDALFTEGKRLDNYTTHAVCSPSRAGLLTGRHYMRVNHSGVYTEGELEVDEETTIAQSLQAAGFKTGLIGKWHNGEGPDDDKKPSAHVNEYGFDRFVGYYGGGPDFFTRETGSGKNKWYHDDVHMPNETGYTTDLIDQYALEFLETNKNDQFFCMISHQAVHAPMQAKYEDYINTPTSVRNGVSLLSESEYNSYMENDNIPDEHVPIVYSAIISSLDRSVGLVRDWLADNNLEDNTIILFASDNGPTENGDNGPFKGYKHEVYEGGIHVPAAIYWPNGEINTGETYTGDFNYLDILPTTCAMLEVDHIGTKPLDGRDLSNEILTSTTNTTSDQHWINVEYGAVRWKKWKLMYKHKNMELYNLQNDIGETTNKADDRQDIIDQIVPMHEQWLKDNNFNPNYIPYQGTVAAPAPSGEILEVYAEQTSGVSNYNNGCEFVFARAIPDVEHDPVRAGDLLEYDIYILEDGRNGDFFLSTMKNMDKSDFRDYKTGYDNYGRLQRTGPGVQDGKGVWEHRVIGIGNQGPLGARWIEMVLFGDEPGTYHFYIDNLVIRRADGRVQELWVDGSDTRSDWDSDKMIRRLDNSFPTLELRLANWSSLPEANFTASETTIEEGESITFTDASTNDPTSWVWTFDGGAPATSTEQNPTVSYALSGTYDVTLTATNAGGDGTITKTGYITVNEPADTVDVPVGESFQSGVVNVATSGPTDWATVTFSAAMSEAPIVAAGPLSYNGGDPSTLRVRNVSTTGFEIQIDEWDYLNGAHNNAEDIYYMAVIPGNHDFGGLLGEAGAISVTSSWSTHSLSQSFSDTPVILAVQVTDNESDATYQRLRNVSETGFDIKLKEQQANTQSHVAETIHYIALGKGTGTFNDRAIEVGSTGESVDEVWYTQSFETSYTNSGILAHIQTETGGDPVSLRQRNLSDSSVEFLVQEEKSSDNEIGHSLEEVGWVRIENISEETTNARTTSTEEMVEEETLETAINFYPNPVGDVLNLEIGDVEGLLRIISLEGKVVKKLEVNSGHSIIDVSKLKAGVYMLKLEGKKGESLQFKITKK